MIVTIQPGFSSARFSIFWEFLHTTKLLSQMIGPGYMNLVPPLCSIKCNIFSVSTYTHVLPQVNLGWPLPLVLPSAIINLLYRQVYAWHVQTTWVSFPLFCIGATSNILQVCSFPILYFLDLPHIHLDIRISATPIIWTCMFLCGTTLGFL